MGHENYRKAYESAAKELNDLLEQQEKSESRIMALRKTMNNLSTLCQQEGIDLSAIDRIYGRLLKAVESSLTDDIYRIISNAKEPLTTSEVRQELNELGGSLAEHKNPLASINAILNRLEENGRAFETVKDGRKAWRPKFFRNLDSQVKYGSAERTAKTGDIVGDHADPEKDNSPIRHK